MKTRMVVMAVGLMLAMVAPARAAGLLCISDDGAKELVLTTWVGVKEVTLKQDGQGDVVLQAQQTGFEQGMLYTKVVYELSDAGAENAILTIVKRLIMGRGGCGRGGCDQDAGSRITAELLEDGVGNLYSCDETFF